MLSSLILITNDAVNMTSNMTSNMGVCFLSTGFGVPDYTSATAVGLIILLSIKGIMAASKKWTQLSNDSLDLGIYPLFVCFLAIFLFKVSSIVIHVLSVANKTT